MIGLKMSNKNGIFVIYRGMEQLVARRAHNPKVGGSNPSPATRSNPVLKPGFFYVHLKLSDTKNFNAYLNLLS